MNITYNGIALPEDIRWTDRYSAVRAKTDIVRSLNGRQIIERTILITGWHITLEGGADFGWMTKADIDAVRASYFENPPNEPPRLLVIDGTSYYVLFTDDGFSADAVQVFNDFVSTDHFIPKFKFVVLALDEQPLSPML